MRRCRCGSLDELSVGERPLSRGRRQGRRPLLDRAEDEEEGEDGEELDDAVECAEEADVDEVGDGLAPPLSTRGWYLWG